MRKYIAALLLALALTEETPPAANASTTYVFQFEPTSIVGPMPIPFIWLSEEAYLAGGVAGSNLYGTATPVTGLELFRFDSGLSFSDLTLQAPTLINQLDQFKFEVSGDYLGGFFKTGGNDTVQTQGSGTSSSWLIGYGADGGRCFGNLDPYATEGGIGVANACRAEGVFHLVGTIPETGTLPILVTALLILSAYHRPRLIITRCSLRR